MMAITLPLFSRLQLAPGRMPIRYRLLIAFTVPLAIWILVSSLNIAVWNHAMRNNESLIASQRSILLANRYLATSLRAQAAKYAYLLTSQPDVARTFRDAASDAAQIHFDLKALQRDDPEQLELLEEAGRLFQEWLYDVGWQRIQARRALPFELVRNAQELQKSLLLLQDAHIHGKPPPRDLMNDVRDLGESLLRHEALGDHEAAIREALDKLPAYQASMVNGQIENASEVLHQAIALLTRAIEDVLAYDRDLRNETARGEDRILLDRFRERLAEFVSIEERQLAGHHAVMEQADRRGRLLLWLGPALGLVMMVAITAWTSRRISNSLEGISRAARGLAKGDLGTRARVRGSDEFAVLAKRFNSMAELVENRSRESAALAELGELLQSSTSINEAARIFAELAGKLFPGQPGVLYLVSPSRDEVTAAACWLGGETLSQTEFVPEDCWALRLSRTHDNGADNAVECSHLLAHDRNSVCLPLHAFGETMGMLHVIAPEGGRAKNDHGQRGGFLDTVAEQVALALANLRMRETLRNQSIRDPLTQLYNRRYMDETFRRELHRAARHNTPLSVLTFDIDHFKRFNDTHGHDGGDVLLKAVGNSLRDFFRAEDGAFRSGGEEFVAILPETTLEDARVRAEELRRDIAGLEVKHGNLVLPAVTVSVGIASFPEHGKTTQALLKAADRALYQAKETGRNRVVTADGNSEG